MRKRHACFLNRFLIIQKDSANALMVLSCFVVYVVVYYRDLHCPVMQPSSLLGTVWTEATSSMIDAPPALCGMENWKPIKMSSLIYNSFGGSITFLPDIYSSMSVYIEIKRAALYLISGKWLYSPTGPDLLFNESAHWASLVY